MTDETPTINYLSNPVLLISDADFLSSWIWIGDYSLLQELHAKIVIPYKVIEELSRTKHPLYQKNLNDFMQLENNLWTRHYFSIQENTSEDYELYNALTRDGYLGKKIDPGEAACIAIAKYSHERCMVASNNLRDISTFLDDNNITGITTGRLITYLFLNQRITKTEADSIWSEMIRRKRKIGAETFDIFLAYNEVAKDSYNLL